MARARNLDNLEMGFISPSGERQRLMVRESKYLVYHSVMLPKRKTPILFVCNKSNEELGHIKFYPQWRRFVFYPKADTLLDSSCLEDILFTINLIQQMWINKEDFD